MSLWLSVALAFLSFPGIAEEMPSTSAAEAVAALRRLVEEQNRRIEALTEKVLQLERKALASETPRAAGEAVSVLPTILIDTNGVPLTTASPGAHVPDTNLARGADPAASPSTAASPHLDSARFTAGPEGFALLSADTNFVLRLRGLLQVDSRTYFGDNAASEGNDGFVIRRARPILEGTLYGDVDFQVTPDFAGNAAQLFDANVSYRLRPELRVRVGKFKSPIGLEQLQSDAAGLFNERSPVSQLVPSRSTGVQLSGDLANDRLHYAAGVFGSTGDGRNSSGLSVSDDPELVGRGFVEPWREGNVTFLQGLGVGVGGSFSQIHSNAAGLPGTASGTLPGYQTAGSQQFFAYNPAAGPVVAEGAHWRVSPQVSWYYGSFGLLGEYLLEGQGVLNATTLREAELRHHAWQINGQWVLTGEPASYGALVPRRRFDPRRGGWGAWQLVARYGQLDLDPETFRGFANPQLSARGATAWSVGVNWSLNRNLRVLTSYSQTRFEGPEGVPNPFDPATTVAPGAVTAQDERVLLTRVQLGF